MVAASITEAIATTKAAAGLETKIITATKTIKEIKIVEVSDKVAVSKITKEVQIQTAEVSELKVIATATVTTDQSLRVEVASEVALAAQRVQAAQVVQRETQAALDKTIINKETNS